MILGWIMNVNLLICMKNKSRLMLQQRFYLCRTFVINKWNSHVRMTESDVTVNKNGGQSEIHSRKAFVFEMWSTRISMRQHHSKHFGDEKIFLPKGREQHQKTGSGIFKLYIFLKNIFCSFWSHEIPRSLFFVISDIIIPALGSRCSHHKNILALYMSFLY